MRRRRSLNGCENQGQWARHFFRGWWVVRDHPDEAGRGGCGTSFRSEVEYASKTSVESRLVRSSRWVGQKTTESDLSDHGRVDEPETRP